MSPATHQARVGVRRPRWASLALIGFVIVGFGGALMAQPPGRGPGRGQGRGPGNDPAFQADRDLFHQLLEHHGEIRREVKQLDDGVETVTESDTPAIAEAIQLHVASMEARVRESRPIHRRDPLFDALFRHTKQIEFTYEKTERGVRVRETSQDPFTARLIQAHAAVVSLFVKHGFAEAQRNHEVPAAP